MANKIKLDIISDVVCPWCTIGYKRIEKAMEELGVADKFEIEWQPFELNPHLPKEGENIIDHITNKYGSTLEQQRESQRNMTEAGAELGFTFDYFDEMRMVNTLDAHVLLEYAHKFDKQTELKMRLTKAFFSERKDVSDRAVLKEALEDVGLNAEKALATLEGDEVRYEVKNKETYWHGLGVSSVPTFVFDKKSGVTGAQPVEVFKQVLNDVLAQKSY
ncbi:DsbA family oxidoreductase [Croceivirga sp. JEA036]|uniref:DsbA family oxidoreductase n=1 Tax=Croceivirga sp. JEA036 TaxID=2721162 RepID=UPI00143B3154|nr:DsbA family oxidoreductase [Croceivirga sp. JEA036]NJB38015.1 DsbA family oxidoreductase [Croceivirga sp. JEA036]